MAGDGRLPDFIKNKPDILPGLDWYLSAFADLTTTRINGFGMGRISWQSVVNWGQFHSLSYEDIEDLWYYIKQMDSAYVAFCEKDNK